MALVLWQYHSMRSRPIIGLFISPIFEAKRTTLGCLLKCSYAPILYPCNIASRKLMTAGTNSRNGSINYTDKSIKNVKILETSHLIKIHYVRRCYSKVLKVYTKTGDKGTSSLYSGERKPKDDMFFNALGTIDELSSHIGLAKEFASQKNHDYIEQLERIQCILQDIGTVVATPIPTILYSSEKENNIQRMKRIEKRIAFNGRHAKELEDWIDHFTKSLPPLTNFILPGGGRSSAALHISRAVCRRAERAIVPLVKQDLVDANILVYVNRLSDYLFTVARHATQIDNKKETVYIRPKPSNPANEDGEPAGNMRESFESKK